MVHDFAKAVTYRVGKAKSGTILLWTLQPFSVWDSLRQHKRLHVDPTHPGFEKEFLEPYNWIREQMSRRLPVYHDHYPWWAYDYKLDLRTQSYQMNVPGVRYVRLKLAIPPERVLLSAYGEWHCVLNNYYLPSATEDMEVERELESWEAELTQNGLKTTCPLPEPWHSRMKNSWEHIFDIEDLRSTNTIQATFEYLELGDVIEVTEFTTRSSKWRRKTS